MRSNDHLQHENGASAAFVAVLRFEADAYRLRAWLIHAYELLDSDVPLAADKLRLLKEDVSEAADLARKLIDIYDNKGDFPSLVRVSRVTDRSDRLVQAGDAKVAHQLRTSIASGRPRGSRSVTGEDRE